MRGSSQLVPCSATRPRRENAVVKLALVAANRRSHIIASTNPPPAATPLTAAITGFGTRRMWLNSAGSSSGLGSVGFALPDRLRPSEPGLRCRGRR